MPKKAEQEVDESVAGHARGAYNIPPSNICPRHNTYMPYGFCKRCMLEDDPDAQAGSNERGMTAEEAEYVRKKRGGGQDADELLAEFRQRKAQAKLKGGA